MALQQTPSLNPSPDSGPLSEPNTPANASSPAEALSPEEQTAQLQRNLGFPSPELQAEFDATQKRINESRAKFYGLTSAVVPIDYSKLSDDGKAYREKFDKVGTKPKALRLDAILGRIKTIEAVPRTQALPYDEARIVVDTIYESELIGRDRRPIWDEETDLLLEKITRYFIGDSGEPGRMMKNPFWGEPDEPLMVPVDWIPLSKCLYIYGDVGVGKTFVMTAMQTLAKAVPIEEMKFQIVSSKDIVLDVKVMQSLSPVNRYREGGLLIDDLGEEETGEISIYGKMADPIDHLLSARYRSYIVSGLPTHFTSNKLPSELEALYGTRTYDRLTEMVEPLFFPGKSKRSNEKAAQQ